MNLVSVIMPAFNTQETIATSASSVLAQSHRSLELLIIDDGSTDSTVSISQHLSRQDERVRVIRQEKNGGVAMARNRGIEQARGRYIAFLDADDLWMPDKLERQLAMMHQHNALACMSAYYRFRVQGHWLAVTRPPARITYEGLLKGNVVGNLTGIYNCEVLDKVFQRDVLHEDYLMWLEIAHMAGEILAVCVPLAAYRVGQISLSSDKIRSVKGTWDIYHKHLSLSAAHSAYLMSHYVVKAIYKRL
ncbi:glycosyltransferase family 2 protein [Alcaligenaceae bacterium]|nr:glycosyltransferase family 2 protein [Alcaligenaceae bacterium]